MDPREILSAEVEKLRSLERVAPVPRKTRDVVIVSLGYNCEVASRIEDCFGALESYPFSWAYTSSIPGLFDVIFDHDRLGEAESRVVWKGRGLKFPELRMSFHLRQSVIRDGEVDPELLRIQKGELMARVGHMLHNLDTLVSSGTEIAFLMKLLPPAKPHVWPCEGLDGTIEAIYGTLERLVPSGRFTLTVVLSRRSHKTPVTFEAPKLRVEYVERFANDRLTGIGGDPFGWYRIIDGIVPVSLSVFTENLVARMDKIASVRKGTGKVLVPVAESISDGTYDKGISRMPDDRQLLIDYLTVRAEGGSAVFQRRLVEEYVSGELRSIPQARFWMRKACGDGREKTARFFVDLLVGHGEPEDLAEAFFLAERLASEGHPFAYAMLGRMYADGTGVEKDFTEAVRWMRMAAGEDPSYELPLADLLFDGGGSEDVAESAMLYIWHDDVPHAMGRLGRMYRDGIGVG
ncbi:MAG: sel1 repeat family protein, partial [Candidatus Methanomethylophilaceae archaeon]|nr:sel1 repeat family protein [Candidatus Methanomethylophilaceae archaeon]